MHIGSECMYLRHKMVAGLNLFGPILTKYFTINVNMSQVLQRAGAAQWSIK